MGDMAGLFFFFFQLPNITRAMTTGNMLKYLQPDEHPLLPWLPHLSPGEPWPPASSSWSSGSLSPPLDPHAGSVGPCQCSTSPHHAANPPGGRFHIRSSWHLGDPLEILVE